MTELEEYYNKFNEDKRLTRRHGRVEYITSMKYIHACIDVVMKEKNEAGDGSGYTGTFTPADIRILDVGAGTGRYSVALAGEGYDVTAVELVKYNLGILKSKKSSVKAFQGNALNLSRFADSSFDITLLFGPMYHLYTFEDKVKALGEAKRVTKKNGLIFVAYLMNDYGVLMYGFKENMAKKCLEDGRLTEDFHCVSKEKDLYEYVTLSDIEKINKVVSLQREKIIAPDGAANYMRPVLKEMDEETFELFVRYQMSVAERMDLMGASAHTVDILRVS